MSTKKKHTPAAENTETPPAEAPAPFVLTIPEDFEVGSVATRNLVMDAGTQPRANIDLDIVAEYKELMAAAKKDEKPNPLPAITVVRTPEGKLILVGGFHRVYGAKGIFPELEANIYEGDVNTAIAMSLSENSIHGLRRTARDKNNAVKRALQDPNISTLSNVAIAELCQVSEFLVRNTRPSIKSPAIRTTKAGKTMDTSRVGKKGGKAPKPKKDKKSPKPVAGGDAPRQAKAEAERQERQSEMIARIEKAVGGTEGPKIRNAIVDGSLELSPKELKEFSEYPEKTIQNIAGLVTSGRMKPFKAFEFYTSEPTEKTIEDLHLRAITHGGTYEFANDSVKIVVSALNGK